MMKIGYFCLGSYVLPGRLEEEGWRSMFFLVRRSIPKNETAGGRVQNQ
jgi:hypothetical protein